MLTLRSSFTSPALVAASIARPVRWPARCQLPTISRLAECTCRDCSKVRLLNRRQQRCQQFHFYPLHIDNGMARLILTAVENFQMEQRLIMAAPDEADAALTAWVKSLPHYPGRRTDLLEHIDGEWVLRRHEIELLVEEGNRGSLRARSGT